MRRRATTSASRDATASRTVAYSPRVMCSVRRLARVTRFGSVLRYRDYRLFLASMFASELGMQMTRSRSAGRSTPSSGKPLDLGLVGLCEFPPLPLLALPAGHLADRVPRRSMIVGAIALDGAVPAACWPDCRGPDRSGRSSLSRSGPALRRHSARLREGQSHRRSSPSEVLSRALAVRSVAFRSRRSRGRHWAACSSPSAPRPSTRFPRFWRSLRWRPLRLTHAGRAPASDHAPGLDSVFAGIRLIRRTPVMLGAISLDLFAVLFGGAVALLPVFAKDVLHVGPAGLGVLRSAPAVGALVAALLLTRRPVGRFAGRKLLGVVAAFGVCMIVFGLSRWMWLSFVALAVERRGRPGQCRPPLDDPAARDSRRAARARDRCGDDLHQRVERARRVRVWSGRGSARRSACSGGRWGRDHRDRGGMVTGLSAARAGRPPRRATAGGGPGLLARLMPSVARSLGSLPAGTPLIDASTSSIGWRAGNGCFIRRSVVASWTRQPGFALAKACAPVASTWRAFRSPSLRAASAWTTL